MSVQHNEISSFKLLLKQVYSVHTSKVKELENEVKLLKEKLLEKVREPDNISDCKRCVELEEAFKSCKKALHEQSKWFESFGQKFSIFNGTEQENQDLKIPAKTCKSEATKTSINLTDNTHNSDKTEPSILSPEENVLNKNKADTVFKDSVTSNNPNLLKKVMSDDGGLDTLDLYTVTFPQNLKSDVSKSDSAIFAPDSLDIDHEAKKGVKRASTDNLPEERNNKKVPNHKESESCEKDKVTSKMLSSDSSNKDTLKISHNNGRLQKDCDVTKSINGKVDHTIVQKSIISNIGTTHATTEKSKNKATVKMLSSDSLNKDKLNKIEDNSDITKSTNGKADDTIIQMSALSNIGNTHKAVEKSKDKMKDLEEKKFHIPKNRTDIKQAATSNDKANAIQKSNVCISSTTEVKKISSPYQTSPSLLPMNVNPVPKIIDLESIASDNDDFIEHASCNKPLSSDDSWDTCDKKKTVRRKPALKSIKSTSKYKMALHAPPINYKKPSYKQVKLSKSFFQGKDKSDNAKDKIVEKSGVEKKDTSPKETEKVSLPTIFLEEFQTITPCNDVKSPIPLDIDATFIPENYKYEVTLCGTSAVKRNAVEKSHFRNGSLFSNISFPGELKSASESKNSDIEEINDSPSFEDAEFKENVDSFDKLPVPEEPNYKYKNDVVRKKSERKQLNAFDCMECEKYYSDLGLTDKEKKERMKKCSRHRAKFAAPSTPDHFWELDFPDTQECKARGYMNETQKVKLNNLCDI